MDETDVWFQYRKRYGLHAISLAGVANFRRLVSIPQAVWIACNVVLCEWLRVNSDVSIPQAVWIACNIRKYRQMRRVKKFQYRKRYGLHAIGRSEGVRSRWERFNTASGMDCMQWMPFQRWLWRFYVSIPQAVWIACNITLLKGSNWGSIVSIPQAVWIACNMAILYMLFALSEFQYRKRYGLHAIIENLNRQVFNFTFQYRKRYGLHAILSPRTLENSEPKRWFSNTPSLFAPFPKPQGIFLSQKAVQKGCKASNIKETFVHEENLKLMTSFRKSRTSL